MMHELQQFFAGYFHEDWPMEAASPEEVLSAYIAEGHSRAELARLADMLDSYISSAVSDEALDDALFTELGCYYTPSADGLSTRAWLVHVADRLRAASNE